MLKYFQTTNIKAIIFPAILMILCYINLQYMHYSILADRFSLTSFSYIENILQTFADVCLIFFIPIFLIKKRIYLFFIPYFLITLFSIINVWYSRYFYTYMPPTLYLEFNNLNGLSRNIFAAVTISDLIILITTTLAVISYRVFGKEDPHIIKKTRIGFTLATFGCALIIIGILVGISTKNWGKLEYKYVHPFKNSPTESIFKFGILYGTTMQYIMNNKREYNPSGLVKYKPLFNETGNRVAQPQKNLIFILVESLISFATDLSINGVEITPNLNRLVKEGAYYNNNMTSEVELGESSDGQFIYINGLLPKKKGVTIFDYFNNEFKSLPKFLKEKFPATDCKMIIPTSSKTWRQDGVCIQYGFDKLYSRKGYTLTEYDESWLNDQLLFEYAADIDKNSKQPFLSFILTSSTHSPYTKLYKPYHISFPDSYSEELKVYLSNVHYMDECLGKYINFLKANHLYKNTLIVVTSDHAISNDWLKSNNDSISSKIPLYIINSPQKINKETNFQISQADVFPTLLDLTGIQSQWRGVGNSLLTSDSILNTPREKERLKYREEISGIILDSNYFKRK